MGADPDQVLHGRGIVITRSAADNVSLGIELRRLGANVVEVPLIEVLPPQDGGVELRAAATRIEDYRWVVLTSVNAVDALVGALVAVSEAEDRVRWPDVPPVAAVGPSTAEAARAAGLVVSLVPDTATAAALVEDFPQCPETGSSRVLAPLAELAGPTVVDGLAARGYEVDRLTAYRTVAERGPAADAPDPATVADADAVAFFSPSAVDRFIERFGAGSLVAVCIGPSTAERAHAHPFCEVIVAEPHTEAGVIGLICDRFGSRRG